LDFLRRADNVLLIGKPSTGNGPLREACLPDLFPLLSNSEQRRRRLDCPLSATSGLMHCSKQHIQKDRLAAIPPKSDQVFRSGDGDSTNRVLLSTRQLQDSPSSEFSFNAYHKF
jgi:hypothetical protein